MWEIFTFIIMANIDLRIVTWDELSPGLRYGVGVGWIIFLLAQKQIVQGIATTGLKG